jgi:hypothetical protein
METPATDGARLSVGRQLFARMAEADGERETGLLFRVKKNASRNDHLDGHRGTEAPACLSLPCSPLAPPSTPTALSADCVCVCIFAGPRVSPLIIVALLVLSSLSHCLSPLSQCSPSRFIVRFILCSVSRNRAAPLLPPRDSPVVRSALVKEPSSFSSSFISFLFFFILVLRLFDPSPRNRAPLRSSSILP